MDNTGSGKKQSNSKIQISVKGYFLIKTLPEGFRKRIDTFVPGSFKSVKQNVR
jgi:hypothetical protein